MNLHQYASADEMWTVWKENFTRICDKHAPKKRRKVCNKSNVGSMISFYMKKRHKNYLKQKAYKTGNLEDWENYRHARNNYNKLIKNTIKSHYSNDNENNKGNLKKTWKSINQYQNRNPKSKRIAITIKMLMTKILNPTICLMHLTNIFLNIG